MQQEYNNNPDTSRDPIARFLEYQVRCFRLDPDGARQRIADYSDRASAIRESRSLDTIPRPKQLKSRRGIQLVPRSVHAELAQQRAQIEALTRDRRSLADELARRMLP